MSVHEKLVMVAVLMLAPACKGSATAKVNASSDAAGTSMEASANGEPKRHAGEGIWEDSEQAAEPGSHEARSTGGRRVAVRASGEAPTLTLPGFRMLRDGTSRVFVEVSGNVPVKENRSQGVLRYRFDGVVVPERVNTMDLPTRYFPTPVSRVHVVKLDHAAELVIELRVPTRPKVRLRQTDDGTVLSVDFPRLETAGQGAMAGDPSVPSGARAPGR